MTKCCPVLRVLSQFPSGCRNTVMFKLIYLLSILQENRRPPYELPRQATRTRELFIRCHRTSPMTWTLLSRRPMLVTPPMLSDLFTLFVAREFATLADSLLESPAFRLPEWGPGWSSAVTEVLIEASSQDTGSPHSALKSVLIFHANTETRMAWFLPGMGPQKRTICNAAILSLLKREKRFLSSNSSSLKKILEVLIYI